MTIRLATAEDIAGIVRIKQRLAFAGPSRGGFLLGCSEDGYRERLRDGRIWVLQSEQQALAEQQLLGFSITLYPEALRTSPLWALRERVTWSSDAELDFNAVGYFDQLAVLPEAGHRAALQLAFVALSDLSAQCAHIVTTTVSAPVQNLAAVPLIQRVGGQCVGQLNEIYPELGALTSDIWLISSREARTKLQQGTQLAQRWLRTQHDAFSD